MHPFPADAPKAPGSQALAALRTGTWLNRGRLLAYGRLLLILELVALVVIALGTHGLLVPLDEPTSTDFISFYSAGYLADHGTPALAYDQTAHRLAEQTVFGDPHLPYAYWFFYPPTFLLYCAALASLPYLASFAAWILATGSLYVLALRSILRDRALVIAFLSFPSAAIAAGIGQNSFATAAIFAAATSLVDRLPVLAGAILGVLCYKPHFLLIAPVALLAGRRWRALGAMAAMVAFCTCLTLLLFGWETWDAFLHLTRTATATFETGKVGFAGLVSLFGAVRMLDGPVPLAYGIQGLAALAAAALAAFAWYRDLSLPVRAMTLVAGSLFAAPIILFYDLLPMTVAIAWLARDARKTGFLPWEKAILAVLWLVPIASRSAGIALAIPLGPVATIGLMLLVWRRTALEAAKTPAGR
jgi:hypothetical protein